MEDNAMTFTKFLMLGRRFIDMLVTMSNNVITFFSTPLEDMTETLQLPGVLNQIIDLILEHIAIGQFTPMSLMFGSGIIFVILLILKKFVV